MPLDIYYQRTTELTAGIVIAGIIWTSYAALWWRPWMR
jgi:hypothetical protein